MEYKIKIAKREPKQKTVTIRLAPTVFQQLDDLCKFYETDKSDYVSQIIEQTHSQLKSNE